MHHTIDLHSGAALTLRTFEPAAAKARAPGVPLYWRENSWQTKRFVWWLWFVVAPLAMRIAGYFPGKRLRKVGDLPRAVMEQWRRWCLNREYVVDVEGEGVRRSYASVRTPTLSLSFTDDEMMSEQGIRSLHGLYANVPIEYRRIAPHTRSRGISSHRPNGRLPRQK
jgi:predicted alpha/beta hydrolase